LIDFNIIQNSRLADYILAQNCKKLRVVILVSQLIIETSILHVNHQNIRHYEYL